MHKQRTLTLLFVDICASTRLFEVLGDTAARTIISEVIDHLIAIITHYDGQVIKMIGDELMVTFEEAALAIFAADNMQLEVTNERFGVNQQKIDLRIGINTGIVIDEGDDVFGDSVNIAARVAALAKARQILLTCHCLNAISGINTSEFRLVERTQVKGKTEIINVFERLWEYDDSEITVVEVRPDTKLDAYMKQLLLSINAENFIINDSSPVKTIGRDKTSDIIILAAKASRIHARIECHKHRYILTDQSSNGTYVRTEGGIKLLHRDTMELTQSGVLGFGEKRAYHETNSLYFVIEN